MYPSGPYGNLQACPQPPRGYIPQAAFIPRPFYTPGMPGPMPGMVGMVPPGLPVPGMPGGGPMRAGPPPPPQPQPQRNRRNSSAKRQDGPVQPTQPTQPAPAKPQKSKGKAAKAKPEGAPEGAAARTGSPEAPADAAPAGRTRRGGRSQRSPSTQDPPDEPGKEKDKDKEEKKAEKREGQAPRVNGKKIKFLASCSQKAVQAAGELVPYSTALCRVLQGTLDPSTPRTEKYTISLMHLMLKEAQKLSVPQKVHDHPDLAAQSHQELVALVKRKQRVLGWNLNWKKYCSQYAPARRRDPSALREEFLRQGISYCASKALDSRLEEKPGLRLLKVAVEKETQAAAAKALAATLTGKAPPAARGAYTSVHALLRMDMDPLEEHFYDHHWNTVTHPRYEGVLGGLPEVSLPPKSAAEDKRPAAAPAPVSSSTPPSKPATKPARAAESPDADAAEIRELNSSMRSMRDVDNGSIASVVVHPAPYAATPSEMPISPGSLTGSMNANPYASNHPAAYQPPWMNYPPPIHTGMGQPQKPKRHHRVTSSMSLDGGNASETGSQPTHSRNTSMDIDFLLSSQGGHIGTWLHGQNARSPVLPRGGHSRTTSLDSAALGISSPRDPVGRYPPPGPHHHFSTSSIDMNYIAAMPPVQATPSKGGKAGAGLGRPFPLDGQRWAVQVEARAGLSGMRLLMAEWGSYQSVFEGVSLEPDERNGCVRLIATHGEYNNLVAAADMVHSLYLGVIEPPSPSEASDIINPPPAFAAYPPAVFERTMPTEASPPLQVGQYVYTADVRRSQDMFLREDMIWRSDDAALCATTARIVRFDENNANACVLQWQSGLAREWPMSAVHPAPDPAQTHPFLAEPGPHLRPAALSEQPASADASDLLSNPTVHPATPSGERASPSSRVSTSPVPMPEVDPDEAGIASPTATDPCAASTATLEGDGPCAASMIVEGSDKVYADPCAASTVMPKTASPGRER
eukprot:TRINITY_DN4399_c0_g4_i1.p1 TRINITY_DN4399_c0_g4~~TRINITY_DN4399_c0_g4_i1.p1  ORF type:complete len:996 (+),score=263.40 TRINITY_DN4399_c0_g4_i1:74-2989(+)